MINPSDFYNTLMEKGVDLYAGVPDSLLANFCTFIDSLNNNNVKHIIAANEGNAVALAIGYHLATGKVPAVYMQNSGLGNTINPLASLADSKVYRTPMLLIIGWRGEPGIKDEPQHIKQGQVTLGELELHDIPYKVMDSNSNVNELVHSAFETIIENNTPFAIVVKKNTFAKPELNTTDETKQYQSNLVREDVLSELLSLIHFNDLIISTTGKTSREIFEIRASRGEMQRDFLTVGGMGHTSSIALGVAIGEPNKKVICIDGDGSLIMHMGSMPVISDLAPKNFIHILLNNQVHESVGGQRTSAENINFKNLTNSVGYKNFEQVTNISSLNDTYKKIIKLEGPSFIEVKIKPGSRDDLGRPTSTAEENKKAFMNHVKS